MTDAITLLGPTKPTQPPPGMSWTLHVRHIGEHLYAAGNLGHSGVLARTADDGATWQVLLRGVNGLRQVWGASDDEVFVVGEYGFVRRVRVGRTVEVQDVPCANGGCLFGVIADEGRLLVSGDNGVFEWREGRGFVSVLRQRGLARLYDSPRGVVVIGDRDDAGPAVFVRDAEPGAAGKRAFNRVAVPAAFDAYGFLALEGGSDDALVCGTEGQLWSVSLSNTRRPVRVPVETRGILLAIQRVKDHIVVVGDGFVGASSDGGASFVTLPPVGNAWSLAVSSSGAVVVAGRGVFVAWDSGAPVARPAVAPLDPATHFVVDAKKKKKKKKKATKKATKKTTTKTTTKTTKKTTTKATKKKATSATSRARR